jgi:DNA-binding response OmpR family regulator
MLLALALAELAVRVCLHAAAVTRTVLRLLCHLAGEPTRVFTREELMRDVWGYQSTGRTRTLDSHVLEHGFGRRLCGLWVLSGL